MNLLVIGPAYPYKGGIAHYNNWLCNFLSKRHSVQCISFKRQYPKIIFPGKSQKDSSAPKRVKFRILEMLDSINPLTWMKAIRYIKEKKPDYVLLYWWTPYFSFMNWYITNSLKDTRTKVIYLCHNVLPHEKRFIDKELSRLALKHSDYFIVHADKEREDLRRILPEIPEMNIITAVHPSYDVQFKFSPIEKPKARKKLNLKGKVMLFFGFVRDYKGLMYLIDAMPLILKKVDVTLLIVGEFWKGKGEYVSRVEELGIEDNVRIIDKYVPDEDVAQYYVASDVVVLPYLSATNSGIVQIAYGFDRPVIVTDVGGLPEIVKHGKTGFVVKPEDSREIAEAVLKFYTGDKSKVFRKHILDEKERFSWDRMVEIFENIDKLSERNRKGGKI